MIEGRNKNKRNQTTTLRGITCISEQQEGKQDEQTKTGTKPPHEDFPKPTGQTERKI